MTLRHVNNQPDHIQKHLTGYRFLKSYDHWLHCQETGKTYVPFCKQKNAQQTEETENGDIDDDNSDAMSDLYPGKFDLKQIFWDIQ